MITAQFAGKCAVCGQYYKAGASIENVRGKWQHAVACPDWAGAEEIPEVKPEILAHHEGNDVFDCPTCLPALESGVLATEVIMDRHARGRGFRPEHLDMQLACDTGARPDGTYGPRLQNYPLPHWNADRRHDAAVADEDWPESC